MDVDGMVKCFDVLDDDARVSEIVCPECGRERLIIVADNIGICPVCLYKGITKLHTMRVDCPPE